MEIKDALRVFSINNISDENEITIKKKYRGLVKMYHPDSSNGDDIKFKETTSAYEMLLELLKKIELLKIGNNRTEQIIQITLDELINIYRNGSTNTIFNKTVTKSDLYKHRVLILFSVSISYDEVTRVESCVNLWNVEDKYDVHITTKEIDSSTLKNFKINILNYEKNIESSSTAIKFVTTIDYNIKLSIIINRKVGAD